jgi:regulator of sirC expression with transglutaminase-like and TPR domain
MPKFFYFLFIIFPLFSEVSQEEKIRTLYHGLKQDSIKEMLAFYSLFQDHPYGKKALEHGLLLINQHRNDPLPFDQMTKWPKISLSNLVLSIGNKMQAKFDQLNQEEIQFITHLSSHLKHHQLKGHQIQNYLDSLSLEDREVDVARTLFLYQFDNNLEKVLAYEASLDLMTLEILAKLPKNRTIKQTLEAMHQLIYFEMGFRFPPHSLWAKDVDTFTFLPSVMDDRYGVCLGVSILYISLGQRLGLPFCIYTPPGHIFLQAVLEDDTKVNIETTARGIHIPMEEYLGINQLYLEKRSLKETFGMALMNDAAAFWEKENHEKALNIYQKALPFMPYDPLLNYFIAINALLVDQKTIAKNAFSTYLSNKKKDQIKEMTILEDYFQNQASLEGIKAIFSPVDNTRESILAKKETLLSITQKYPRFREGLFHLAVCYFQLSNYKKALDVLKQYHVLDSTNPTCEYYLAHLYLNRLDYKKANQHLLQAEKLMKDHQKSTKLLRPLKLELMKILCID